MQILEPQRDEFQSEVNHKLKRREVDGVTSIKRVSAFKQFVSFYYVIYYKLEFEGGKKFYISSKFKVYCSYCEQKW